MAKQSENTKPIFSRIVEKSSEEYGMQEQVIVQVKPWEMENEKTKKVNKGHSLVLKRIKFGQKPSNISLYLDAANREVREAIDAAYDAYDALSE